MGETVLNAGQSDMQVACNLELAENGLVSGGCVCVAPNILNPVTGHVQTDKLLPARLTSQGKHQPTAKPSRSKRAGREEHEENV